MTRERERYVWSDEQKASLRRWQPKLRRQLNGTAQQVARFKEHLPDLAEEAATTARPFLEAGAVLVRLNHRNRYNPIPAETAEEELAAVERKYAAWVSFVTRSDVSRAIAQTNRRIRTEGRERRDAARAAYETHDVEAREREAAREAAAVLHEVLRRHGL